MQRKTQGFTLIELLVVVLIIGILAAVALPQYQKAVKKSRFASLKEVTRALANAEEIYYLANGTYTVDIDELTVDFPGPITKLVKVADTNWGYTFGTMTCALINNGYYGNTARVQCTHSDNLIYGIFLQHAAPDYAGKQRCGVELTTAATASMDHQICRQESGKTQPDSGGRDYFY